MIDTGRTLALAARTLHEKGAKTIYALISHGLLSEVNMSLIEDLPIVKLVVCACPLCYPCLPGDDTFLQVTNTISQKQHIDKCSKLFTMDISPTIAESIRRTHNGESISLLFGEWADGAGGSSVGLY